MKKVIVFIFLSMCIQNTYAQRGGRSSKIKALKIAFITEKLNLSEDEAEKFWPLYNQYEKANHKLFKQEKHDIKTKIKSAGGIDSITEKEAISYLELLQKIKASHHEIKEKFYDNLLNFLPAKKVLQLEISEHEFRRNLMKKLRNKKRR